MGLGSFLFSVTYIVGAIVGYVPQYRTIQTTRNAEGFSTLVSVILISANTMKLFFWFGEKFGLTLVFQAIATIAFQFALIEICLRVGKGSTHPAQAFRKPALEFQNFQGYLTAWASMVAVTSVFTWIFWWSDWYFQSVGSLALGLEAVLAVPQVFKNFQNRSTDGLRYVNQEPCLISLLMPYFVPWSSAFLAWSWLIGDSFKVTFVLVNGEPLQFLLSAAFQILVDLVILVQLYVLFPARDAGASFSIATWLKPYLRGWISSLGKGASIKHESSV